MLMYSKGHAADFLKIKNQGFAVFSLLILLSMACLTFSIKMASIVRLDEQRLADNFRRLEAFTHADSGIRFIASQITSVEGAQRISAYIDKRCHLSKHDNCAPYLKNKDPPFTLNLSKQNKGSIKVTSEGISFDGQAYKNISINIKRLSACPALDKNPKHKTNEAQKVSTCYDFMALTWRDF
ncbi:hypothetical protein PCNPT3_01870 [Psychromonas sp. CNPT3]|uniref:pilus assembly PilX N-terminal domain-containing protein n=1 Tax=Psychromonas sp. CNPT3 TaxID=314282 RepID=UPI00006E763B|nr:pilus assembly PilX N-terminal domain-containing protein [Psychromonas sp. CNPT3]AGH80316.1 hypothetical protein PCNPT3_01870 [Psychromonas sp. CNPT3]